MSWIALSVIGADGQIGGLTVPNTGYPGARPIYSAKRCARLGPATGQGLRDVRSGDRVTPDIRRERAR